MYLTATGEEPQGQRFAKGSAFADVEIGHTSPDHQIWGKSTGKFSGVCAGHVCVAW